VRFPSEISRGRDGVRHSVAAVRLLVDRPVSYAEEVLLDGPMVYLRLGDDTAQASAWDASGNSRHAVYVGAYSHTAAPGLLPDDGIERGGGVYLPANAYAALGANSFFAFSGTINHTVEAIVQVPSYYTAEPHAVGGRWDGVTSRGWLAYIDANSGTLNYLRGNGGANVAGAVTPAGSLVVGRRYHVVARFFGVPGTASFDGFLNGLAGVTVTDPGIQLNVTSINAKVGAANPEGSAPWYGRMIVQEYAVYSGKLGNDRVQAHARAAGLDRW
jgi:hypothetical protein